MANSLLIPIREKKNTSAASLVPMPEMLSGRTDNRLAMLTIVARCMNEIFKPRDNAKK